jgi:hypothetical protein
MGTSWNPHTLCNSSPITLVQTEGGDNTQAAQGTRGDKSAATVAEWPVPKAENAADDYVVPHKASMAIRYNRGFRNTELMTREAILKS